MVGLAYVRTLPYLESEHLPVDYRESDNNCFGSYHLIYIYRGENFPPTELVYTLTRC